MTGRLPFFGAGVRLIDGGLPRRLSCRQGDPDYDATIAARLSDRVDVLLDGVVQESVASWDVDMGRIERQARDADGRMILNRGLPTLEIAYGKVEVRWIREAGQ